MKGKAQNRKKRKSLWFFLSKTGYLKEINPTLRLISKNLSEAATQMCSVKTLFLEISQNSQGDLHQNLWHRCFPVNFAKFLWTPFLTEHLRCARTERLLAWTILVKSYIETNFRFDWTKKGIPRFLGKTVKKSFFEICHIVLSIKINPREIFVGLLKTLNYK